MSAIDLAAALVKAHEGCHLVAYRDGGGVWTIGYGHTGADVHAGLSWTQSLAEEQLMADLGIAEKAVTRLKRRLLSDPQLAAMISLTFNIGAGALAESQLLRAVNDCRWIDAAHAWVQWDHAGQVESKGLLIRRFTEAALFLTGS